MEFERLKLLVGDKIKNLQNKTVLIIGLGGVGGYATESLARSNIGKIILVDNDVIDITNMNRQIIANYDNIGKSKADEWEKRIKSINKNIKIEKIKEFITYDNINLIFDKQFDYLIDACDTVKTKKALIRICLNKNIPFISSMGTGKKFHPEKLKIMDVRKTSYDPIAKTIRKMIKDEKIKGKVPVVCSDEIPKKIDNNVIGSNAFVPSTAGLLCASYIFNLIVGD